MERIYPDGYSPVSGCGASRIAPLSGNMPTALVTTRISALRADDQIRFSRGKIGLFVAQGLPYFLQEEFRRHRRNWRAGPKRECLPQRVGRNHEGRANAAGRRGQGVQTGRADLREISDRTGLSRRRDKEPERARDGDRAAPARKKPLMTAWGHQERLLPQGGAAVVGLAFAGIDQAT